MIQKIATAAVYVDDQKKAVDFWTNKVGFVVHSEKVMTPEASWIEVGPKAQSPALLSIQNR